MLTLYSKVNCDYCKSLEQVFKVKGIEYDKKTLNVDFTRQEFIEKFGATTFPRVLKEDGELIGGASETVVYLKQYGLI